MSKISFCRFGFLLFILIASCKKESCFDGIKNQNETNVDCGGVCDNCGTCSDGILNQNEINIDCGGVCDVCETCNDGIKNQDETNVDCGGVCNACETCSDGILNQNEIIIDCGGICTACVPTKTLMEGVWEVTEAYDSAGTNILDTLKVLKKIPPFFHLSSDGTVISTAGPMILYVVYNETFLSKLSLITSTIDQIFNYFDLNFNGGEFFIATGVVDRFTLEMQLEGIAGTSTLKDILTIFGVQPAWLETVVYHKFKDVKLSFQDTVGNIMVWEFDDQTTAEYNTKDQFGNKVLWQGWPVNNFAKCKFILTKRSKDLQTLVTELQ